MALSLHYIKQPHSCPLFPKPLGKSDLQALPVSYILPAVSALENQPGCIPATIGYTVHCLHDDWSPDDTGGR